MGLLKASAITTAFTVAMLIPTCIYNDAKWEKEQQLEWSQDMVRRYSPEKYEELKNAGITDLKTWQEAEYALEDSIEKVRALESDAQSSYFHGSRRMHKGCCR